MLASDTVKGLVSTRVFRHRLEEQIDGTGKQAIVVLRNNGWATPDPVKTAEYPILGVKCYSDASRNATGEIKAEDAVDRAFALARVVARLLHARRGQWWGAVGSNPGLMVVTCQKWKEPVLVTEKDRHGDGAGDPLGDVVYAYVEFALQVVHGQ
jgi:hypothetical protein